MKVALETGTALARTLSAVARRVRWRPRARFDVLFMPYYSRDNVGWSSRFALLEKEFGARGLRTRAHFVPGEGRSGWFRPYWADYLGHARVFWSRLLGVGQALRARAVYVQRGGFPHYPDQKGDDILRLAAALNPNLVLDFYDADYVSNSAVVVDAARHARALTVVNEHLRQWHSPHARDIHVLPMAVDPSAYPRKSSYVASDPLRLFWFGSAGNAQHLSRLKTPLARLSSSIRIRLVVICPVRPDLDFDIEWHRWSDTESLKLLRDSDIAVSPMADSERARGGMALKVMEYFAVGLPVVASPVALSPFAEPLIHFRPAETEEDFYIALRELAADEASRRRLGTAGHDLIVDRHSPSKYADQAVRALFGESPNPSVS